MLKEDFWNNNSDSSRVSDRKRKEWLVYSLRSWYSFYSFSFTACHPARWMSLEYNSHSFFLLSTPVDSYFPGVCCYCWTSSLSGICFWATLHYLMPLLFLSAPSIHSLETPLLFLHASLFSCPSFLFFSFFSLCNNSRESSKKKMDSLCLPPPLRQSNHPRFDSQLDQNPR